MRHALAVMAVLCLPSAALAGPQASNLIINGNFSTGDFTGWSTGGTFIFSGVTTSNFDDYGRPGGAPYALLGPVGGDGTLSQSFADHAGQHLTVSFLLAVDGQTPNDFTASFDGAALLAVSDAPAQGWTEYTYSVTATGLDTLNFSFRDDPGYWALDGISVTQTAVPEPASLAGLGGGLACLAAMLWRTRARKT